MSVTNAGPNGDIVIAPMATLDDMRAFKVLNLDWLSDLGVLNAYDQSLFDNPEKIVDDGGQVLIARHHGRVVGCVGLVSHGAFTFELVKMTVARDMRGRGIGHKLVRAALDHAGQLGADIVFLATRRELADAVHLYEQAGFRHVDPAALPRIDPRADVRMQYRLHN